MTIRFLNCFTCNTRIPSTCGTGLLCMLVETDQEWVLVDPGPGLEDHIHHPAIIKFFTIITKIPSTRTRLQWVRSPAWVQTGRGSK